MLNRIESRKEILQTKAKNPLQTIQIVLNVESLVADCKRNVDNLIPSTEQIFKKSEGIKYC
jgi:hypothetical protein